MPHPDLHSIRERLREGRGAASDELAAAREAALSPANRHVFLQTRFPHQPRDSISTQASCARANDSRQWRERIRRLQPTSMRSRSFGTGNAAYLVRVF